MSLTKKDLSAIGTIIDEKFDKRFDEKFTPAKNELKTFIKQQIAPLNKKLDLVITYFDRVTTKHDIRIKRVEHELHLPPMLD